MKKGFTLIELLVVSTIIVTLMGIATVSYVNATKSARDAKRRTDLEQLRQALETYRSEKGVYPLLVKTGIGTSQFINFVTALTPEYITQIPKDPKYPTTYYMYVKPTSTTYSLCAQLEINPLTPLTNCTGLTCGSAGSCNYEITSP